MQIGHVLGATTALVLAGAVSVWGQGDEKRREFFGSREIDFWGDRARKMKPSSSRKRESIWAEPVRMADGRYGVHLPPKEVVRFLENPSKDGARRYLAWQEERMRKLAAAVRALAEVRNERPAGRRIPLKGAILYFKSPDCSYCLRQDEVLAGLLKANPGIRLRTILPQEEPRLWKKLNVTVVPSLLLTGTGTRSLLVRGSASRERIERIMEDLSHERP